MTVSRLLRFVFNVSSSTEQRGDSALLMEDQAQTGTGLARLHGDSRSRVTMEMMAP